jgi:hypothetical protein
MAPAIRQQAGIGTRRTRSNCGQFLQVRADLQMRAMARGALFHQAILKLDDGLRTVLVTQRGHLFERPVMARRPAVECTFYEQWLGAGAEAADRVQLPGGDFFNKLEYRSGNGGHGRQEEGAQPVW